MEIFEEIEKDHSKILGICNSLIEEQGENKEQLFLNLKKEINLHKRIEENFLYPKLKTQKETFPMYHEVMYRHNLIDHLLEEMTKLNGLENHSVRPEWLARLKVLKDIILVHVASEENQVIPLVRQLISKEEQTELGKEIEKMKNENNN